MNILIENNAFQNFGACINKKCKDDIQVYDFLQLCIQIIFYENISLSGLVPDYVAENSSEIIDLLNRKFNINNIDFQYVKDDKFDGLIHGISGIYYSGIENRLNNYRSDIKSSTLLPDLNDEILNKIKIFTEAIKNSEKRNDIKDKLLEKSSFSEDSAIIKIIMHENKIFDKLIKFSEENYWDEMMTYQLIADLRILTNKRLSEDNEKIYSPSVKRAAKEKQLLNIIIQKIDNIFKDASDNLFSPLFIEIPSIKEYLINKGRNPVDILKNAVELRDKFTPVRKLINESSGTRFIHQIQTLNEIGTKICNEIKFRNPSIIKKVIENTPSLDIAAISIPSPTITKEYLKEKNLWICTQAFTEVIEDMVINNNDYSMEEFIKNCKE